MKILITALPNFSPDVAIVKKILKQLGLFFRLSNACVEVYLIDESFMKTNVLAFPALRNFPRPDLKSYKSLGDLYINPDYIEAKDEDTVFILVHGFLHLLGYDHTIKKDRDIMEAREREIIDLISN